MSAAPKLVWLAAEPAAGGPVRRVWRTEDGNFRIHSLVVNDLAAKKQTTIYQAAHRWWISNGENGEIEQWNVVEPSERGSYFNNLTGAKKACQRDDDRLAELDGWEEDEDEDEQDQDEQDQDEEEQDEAVDWSATGGSGNGELLGHQNKIPTAAEGSILFEFKADEAYRDYQADPPNISRRVTIWGRNAFWRNMMAWVRAELTACLDSSPRKIR